jgi:hypothetical protein
MFYHVCAYSSLTLYRNASVHKKDSDGKKMLMTFKTIVQSIPEIEEPPEGYPGSSVEEMRKYATGAAKPSAAVLAKAPKEKASAASAAKTARDNKPKFKKLEASTAELPAQDLFGTFDPDYPTETEKGKTAKTANKPVGRGRKRKTDDVVDVG